jgi:multimeric flavodoxin WrbA
MEDYETLRELKSIMPNSKKILIILGSPRKNGNSTILAKQLAEGVKASNSEPELIYLQDLKIAPCTACDACLKNSDKKCTINDDMQKLYPKIKAADAIVFASPIYWFNISAQMKLFIDRSYAIQENGKYAFSDKDIGIILTYGDVDVFKSGAINALRSFEDICKFVNAKIIGTIYGTGEKAGDIKNNKELLNEAFELGKKLG